MLTYHVMLCKHTPCNLTELALLYNVTLSDILEKHSPVVTKKVVSRPQVPWYSENVRAAKRKKMKAEQRWLKIRINADWDHYKSLRNSTLHLLNEARKNNHCDLITENKDDCFMLLSLC